MKQLRSHSQEQGGQPALVLSIWLHFASGWGVETKDPTLLRNNSKGKDLTFVSFIRHCESEANVVSEAGGSVKGMFDPNITDKGKQQGLERKKALKDEGWEFDIIFVSPMKRTLQTCFLILEEYISRGVRVVGLPVLREQFCQADDIGRAPAVVKAEWPLVDWSLFPDSPEVWWYTPLTEEELKTETVEKQHERNNEKSWSEPYSVVMDRAGRVTDFLKSRKEKNICVVSHGGFISAVVGVPCKNAQQCSLTLERA